MGTEKEKEKEKNKKNSEYSLSPKKSRNYEIKYKKNIIENPSKIINKTPSRKFKRSYSSCFNERKEELNININKNENIKTPNKNKIPKTNKRKNRNKYKIYKRNRRR